MSSPIVTEATAAAAALLDQVWTPGFDGPSIPVDPFRIARKVGITVYRRQMTPNQSGQIIKTRLEDPIIFLNANDPANRARFTLAHELGHYVKRDGDDTFEYTDNRDELSGAGTNDDERYANAFAAELLMPTEVVKRRASKPVAVLAAEFIVSAEAMKFRLKNLGLSK